MAPGIGFIKDWRYWGFWQFNIVETDQNGVEVVTGGGIVIGMFAFGRKLDAFR
ncbi:MAG: hypothetical protein ACPG4X_15635 [Pikeienuella sp.]